MPVAARSESTKGLSTESVLAICLSVSTIVFLALGLALVEIRGRRARGAPHGPRLARPRPFVDPRAASPWSIRSARQWGQAWRNTDDYRGEERESLVYNNTTPQMRMPQVPRLGYLRDGPLFPPAAAADRSQDSHYQARPAWLPISPPHRYFSSPNLPRDLYQQGQPQPYPSPETTSFAPGFPFVAQRFPRTPPTSWHRRTSTEEDLNHILHSTAQRLASGAGAKDKFQTKTQERPTSTVEPPSAHIPQPEQTAGNTPASGGQQHLPLPRVPTTPPKAATHRSARSRDSASTYSYNPSSIQSTPRRTEAGSPRTGPPTTPARSDPEIYASTPFARPISSPRSMVRLRVPPKLSDPSLQTQHARVASWPPRLDQSKVNATPTHPPQPHSPLWSHPVDPALRHSLRKRALSESSVAMQGVMPG